MARLVLNEIKTRRGKKQVLGTVLLTDKEAEKYFGDDRHIRGKVQIALRRVDRDV